MATDSGNSMSKRTNEGRFLISSSGIGGMPEICPREFESCGDTRLDLNSGEIGSIHVALCVTCQARKATLNYAASTRSRPAPGVCRSLTTISTSCPSASSRRSRRSSE